MILYLPNGHNQPGAKIEIMLRFIDVKLEIVRDKYHTVSESIYQSQYQSWPEPILKTKDGLLFSSHAIMRYLARETERLYGHNMYESSVIEQWLEFASEMSANLVHITEAVLGHRLCTLEQFLIYKKEIFESLKTVDAFLKQHKYLGSNNISIADISLACSLYYVYRLLLDEKKRKDLPNVTQWYVHMAQTKEFELQFGKMWLCQMELIPYFGTKSADKANESKQKNVHSVSDQQKKPIASSHNQPIQSIFSSYKPDKQTIKTMFLPTYSPSSFDLQGFKRQFINKENKLQVLYQFWINFDTEKWSIWMLRYLREKDECKVGYLAKNLKDGFLRNIEHFRKNSFGMLGVYLAEDGYDICGPWLWQGHNIPNEWVTHPSFQSFIFKRLNPQDGNDRNIVNSFWTGTSEGCVVENRLVFHAQVFRSR